MRYASGFATGIIALVCVEVLAWGVVVSPPYRDAYREFQSELPAITRLALSPSWIFGLVAVLALVATGLNLWSRWSETSRAIVLTTLAILSLGLGLGTAFAGVYPFVQLAGRISG